jgi:threonine/homoserine/homoserine lactone efflux protein
MFESLFMKGWLIGFSIAMPVGPIGMVCLNHSLIRGMLCGLAAGLGVALADAFYGVLAAFGVTFITAFLSNNLIWFQFAAAFFLSFVGWHTLKSPLREKHEIHKGLSPKKIFISTFILTLTNPMTLLSFTGLYAGFGIGLQGDEVLSAVHLAGGVFIGSIAWWCILSFTAARFSKKIDFKLANYINKVSGACIIVFACGIALSALHQLFPVF